VLKKAQAENGSFALLSDSDDDPWRTWEERGQEGYKNCQMSIMQKPQNNIRIPHKCESDNDIELTMIMSHMAIGNIKHVAEAIVKAWSRLLSW